MRKISFVFRRAYIIPLIAMGIFLFNSQVFAKNAISLEIKVIDAQGDTVKDYSEFAKSVSSGVSIAAGDLGGDGIEEIVVGSGIGKEPLIKVFRQDGSQIVSFLAYDKSFHGGVNVAIGDVDGNGIDEIITAPESNGGPQVRIFNRYGDEAGFFWAYESDFRGGVSIYSANVDEAPGSEIIAARQSGGDSEIKIFSQYMFRQKSFYRASEAR